MKRLLSVLFCVIGISFSLPSYVFASAIDGVIDTTYKYAWSEKLGWINFGTSQGNVHVLDGKLTGYAWNENTGWINLQVSSSTYVANNGEGTLSGYAWGEGIGYIDFTGVTIDSDGYFHGYASSTLAGQINFNCSTTNTCVSSNWKTKTDWVKNSIRTYGPPTTYVTYAASYFVNQTIPVSSTTISKSTTKKNYTVQDTTKVTSIDTQNEIVTKVLPVKSTCGPYLLKYMKANKTNDPVEVKKLQSFLKKYEGFSNLKKTGTYTRETINAVHSFQDKYMTDILGPWQTGSSTGYVYKTTLKKVNELYCEYTK